MRTSPPSGLTNILHFDLCDHIACPQAAKWWVHLSFLCEGKIEMFITQYTTSEVDLSFVSFLFNKKIHEVTVHCALWPALTAAAHWPVIYTICQDWRCQTEDASWVVSTCPPCCCMAGSWPNGFVSGNRSPIFISCWCQSVPWKWSWCVI